MDSWPELRQILEHLSNRPDHPLQIWPDPRIADRRPPYQIDLAPWATELAAQLHERFGDDVDLTVGALHYPEGRKIRPGGGEPAPPPAVVPPLLPIDKVSVSFDAPVVVASGDTITSQLRVHNHQDFTEAIVTNGHITGRVLDPITAEVVGGYAGIRRLPRVTFQIPPGGSKLIPLLIGTASNVGALGYAIPPGEWALDAIIILQAGSFRTPPLPITVAGRT